MLTALDHVILAVRDLERAAEDTTKLFGRAPSWRGVHPDYGTANVLFRLDNVYVELLAPAGDGPLADFLRAWLDENGEGLAGLVFATGDIDACRAELERRGLCPGPVETGHGRDRVTGAERRWRRVALPTASTRGVLLFPIQHDSAPDVLPPAHATGDAVAAVHAIDHAVVQTSDGDAAKALYGDALGLRLAVDREFPQWGVRLLFFRIGGVTVEMAAALPGVDAATALPGAAVATGGVDRLYGLSWRVHDIDAARARLAAEGVDVSEVRVGRRPGTRVASVRSHNCGVPTLIIQFESEGA